MSDARCGRIKRRVAVNLLLVALLCGVFTRNARLQAAELEGTRPNIVFIISDDQGYGDLGRHGNPILKTPNLDRLAEGSVRFVDFQVSPTCSPTRASLMTGRHEFRSGVTHTIHERERLALQATTIVQLLREANYSTGIFGKWHLGDEAEYLPDRRGFQEVFIHGAGGIGQSYPGSCGDAPGNGYFDPVILHNGVFEQTHGYCTDVFFSQAMDWICTRPKDQPFFAYISLNAPHMPLHVPPGYAALYRDKVFRDKAPSEDVAKFFGMITNIDDNVGRLMRRLKAEGLDRNTLVIYMNDNGGTVGTPIHNAGMRGAKVTPHWGGVRGMSFWHWPGKLQPSDVRSLTAHIDLFPTLAALCGANIPDDVSGKLEGFSLLPLLENPQASWHDDRKLVTHVGRWEVGTPPEKFGPCSVRWRQYLMVREKNRWALYDLRNDPGEERDLAGSQPDVVAMLSRYYDQWWSDTEPQLVNESAHKTAPKYNSFHERYWKQYGGPGPNRTPPPRDFPLTNVK